MNSKTPLRPLFILLLATIVATTQPSSAIAPDKGPNASGEGQFTFIHVPIDFSFSFDVKVNKNGKGHGWAQFDNLSDQTHVVVKIDCVNIGSVAATMGGTVQHSDDPAFPKDATVTFTATDEDSPFGERITPLIVTTFFDCEGALGLSPLSFGDIRIEP